MSMQPGGVTFGGALTDVWNTALGTFNRWVDHQLPTVEMQLAAETAAGQAQLAAQQQPQLFAPAGLPGGDATLLLGAGVLVLAGLLLLR